MTLLEPDQQFIFCRTQQIILFINFVIVILHTVKNRLMNLKYVNELHDVIIHLFMKRSIM